MIDRTTKVLLGLIAAGLWANAMMPLAKPTLAYADADSCLARIDANISALVSGNCINAKLCYKSN
jgi:hypothetical protein